MMVSTLHKKTKREAKRIITQLKHWAKATEANSSKQLLKHLLGKTASTFGNKTATELFTASRQEVEYYRRKYEYPLFRNNSHGGLRWTKFTSQEVAVIEDLLWKSCIQHPMNTVKSHTMHLVNSGYNVSITYVRRILKRWNWNYKKPTIFQIQKYSAENMDLYGKFLRWVYFVPFEKLKFLDESHFKTRSLIGQKALGPKGERTVLVNHQISDIRYTLTLVTSLSNPTFPIVCDLQTTSNTAQSFLRFIKTLVVDQHLQAGDFLVLDNTRIHKANAIIEELQTAVSLVGAQIIFLPAYSPELNPCEKVFSLCKNSIRNNMAAEPLWLQIFKALGTVTSKHIEAFYKHCLRDWMHACE